MSFKGIGSALRDRLVNYPDLVSLIGNRVYPQKLPQNTSLSNTRAAVIYKVLNNDPQDDVSGNASLYRCVYQVETWSQSQELSEQVSEKIRLALQGYMGLHLGVDIRGIYHLNEYDEFEGEVLDYIIIERFSVWYRRENPDHENS